MTYHAFDTHAAEYDAWYDSEPGKSIYALEVECLRPLLHSYPRPYLEVGVGSGRFARVLGIEYGVDPSPVLLEKVKSRGINVWIANGEKLPFPDGSFGGVLTALTLCFVADPLRVIQETSRVLIPEGGLVLGLILRSSPWAEYYARKGEEGHPIYSRARFFFKDEVENLLRLSGFNSPEYRSVLFQPPGRSTYRQESSVPGYRKSAGFIAMSSGKRGI
ncbi:MAG: class I SAM-dependent methyltransferase [Chloroflexota bacterium]|nr:class I SAM-dependent methyltransferase [Chloroflexota bacterium]